MKNKGNRKRGYGEVLYEFFFTAYLTDERNSNNRIYTNEKVQLQSLQSLWNIKTSHSQDLGNKNSEGVANSHFLE